MCSRSDCDSPMRRHLAPHHQRSPSVRRCLRFALAALAICAVGPRGPLAAQPPYPARGGGYLPFDTEDETLAFLDRADVVDLEKMEAGTNKKKRKVVLSDGGLQVRAIHRTTYDYRDMASVGFVDSYLSEVAAHELAYLLGIGRVPAVVKRKVKGAGMGSLQLWIEGATTEADRLRKGIEPPDPERYRQQMDVLHVFDNLIANTDRNPGNILFDSDWRIWFIDHTRSFAGYRELREPDKVQRYERGLWQRLQSVSDEEIRRRVEPYASRYVGDLLERRRLVVELLRQRIAENGEDAVLFTWSETAGESP